MAFLIKDGNSTRPTPDRGWVGGVNVPEKVDVDYEAITLTSVIGV